MCPVSPLEGNTMYQEAAIESARAPAPARSPGRRPDNPGEILHVDLADTYDPARGALEQFVRASFEAAYGARLERLMPLLMSVRTSEDELIAVCGLRDPRYNALYLEQYLDQPVESALERATGAPVSRHGLMEVGNLAVARPGFARHLIAALTGHLHETGRQWAVFTAVPALRNAFARLGIDLVTLCPARIGRLPPRERAQWGRYYDSKPLVMAASVAHSRSALRRLRSLRAAP